MALHQQPTSRKFRASRTHPCLARSTSSITTTPHIKEIRKHSCRCVFRVSYVKKSTSKIKVLWRSLNRWCRIGSQISPKFRTIIRTSCASSPLPSSRSKRSAKNIKNPSVKTRRNDTLLRPHQWAAVRIWWVSSSWDHSQRRSWNQAAFTRCASSAAHWSTWRRSQIRLIRRPQHRGYTRPLSC